MGVLLLRPQAFTFRYFCLRPLGERNWTKGEFWELVDHNKRSIEKKRWVRIVGKYFFSPLKEASSRSDCVNFTLRWTTATSFKASPRFIFCGSKLLDWNKKKFNLQQTAFESHIFANFEKTLKLQSNLPNTWSRPRYNHEA